MSDHDIPNSEPPAAQPPEPKCRAVGGTEYSWCKAVPLGTGVTVLGLLLSKPPDLPLLQNALHNLQNSHPILRSKLRYDPTATTFSFLTPQNPQPLLQIQPFDLQSTSRILQTHPNQSSSVTPFRLIVEHEINNNTTWRNPEHPLYADKDIMYASVYTLSEAQWALTLRLHTSACDRTAAASLLRELLEFVTAMSGYGEGAETEIGDNVEVNLGIEQMIPAGKANKPFWARGVDMLGYSLNSFRLSNLDFIDVDSPKRSQLVRLQMTPLDTQKLLAVSNFSPRLLTLISLLFTVAKCFKHITIFHVIRRNHNNSLIAFKSNPVLYAIQVPKVTTSYFVPKENLDRRPKSS